MAQSTTKPASTNNSFVGPLTPKPRTETPPEFTDKPWKEISINGYHRGWTLQKQWDESGELADMDFFHILYDCNTSNNGKTVYKWLAMLVGFISIIAMLLACLIVFIAALHNRVCRAQQTVWDHTTPIVTALGDRNGHNYLFRFDFYSSTNQYGYTGVAVFVGLNEITFSKYSIENYYTDKHCLSFLTLRGTESTCTKYFLLVDDWYSFERRTWDKGYDAGDCKKVEFYNSVLVLIKYDVMKDTSPKLVGTYSKTRDRLYYIDHENKRMMVTNFKRRISLGLMAASRYEVMCAVARKY